VGCTSHFLHEGAMTSLATLRRPQDASLTTAAAGTRAGAGRSMSASTYNNVGCEIWPGEVAARGSTEKLCRISCAV